MIAIVDYGAGNLNSVKKAFDHLGINAVVTNKPDIVGAAERVVLPGVGHFSSLSALDREGLRDVLLETVNSPKPFLGICLGMQWLFEGSEEAPDIPGSRLLPGMCQKFPVLVKSPHVGWNSLAARGISRLMRGLADDSFVYFTHSFHAPVVAATSAATDYGLPFSAVVEYGNIFGVQFHPEKSGDVGLRILKNFWDLPC